MIVVDASAVLAILQLEPEAPGFARVITGASARFMSAVNLIEVCLVLAGRRRGPSAWQQLDDLVQATDIEVVPFDGEQAHLAREAFLRYGKGRHPAALNLGDCAAYALAKARNLPLLFKGGDFEKTDVASALPAV